MEKEFIHFDNFNLPIKMQHIDMSEGKVYRGIHSHIAIEIVVVKSGTLNCCVDEKTIMLHPEQIIFINSNMRHRLYSENAEIVYYQVDISLLQEHANDNKLSKLYFFILRSQVKPYLVFDDNNEIKELLNKINIIYYENSEESYWYKKAYLYQLVAFMYSQSFILSLMISNEQFQRIERVVYYIDTHFKSPITLEDIGALVKYNKYTICHTFKAITGSTIFEYINFIRVQYAVEKLRDPKNTILYIATECGFSSATYFNKVFKNYIGCSPSVYRKLLSN